MLSFIMGSTEVLAGRPLLGTGLDYFGSGTFGFLRVHAMDAGIANERGVSLVLFF
jgi:hypothetical protein